MGSGPASLKRTEEIRNRYGSEATVGRHRGNRPRRGSLKKPSLSTP